MTIYLIDMDGTIVEYTGHVLYDQPYKQNVDKPRITWENWKDIIVWRFLCLALPENMKLSNVIAKLRVV